MFETLLGIGASSLGSVFGGDSSGGGGSTKTIVKEVDRRSPIEKMYGDAALLKKGLGGYKGAKGARSKSASARHNQSLIRGRASKQGDATTAEKAKENFWARVFAEAEDEARKGSASISKPTKPRSVRV